MACEHLSRLLGVGSDLSAFCSLWGCSTEARESLHLAWRLPWSKVPQWTSSWKPEQLVWNKQRDSVPVSVSGEAGSTWFSQTQTMLGKYYGIRCWSLISRSPSASVWPQGCGSSPGWPRPAVTWTLGGEIPDSERQFPKVGWSEPWRVTWVPSWRCGILRVWGQIRPCKCSHH